MSEWKPIESAPKDGKDYLIFCQESGEQFVAYWMAPCRAWAYAQAQDGPICLSGPSHWRDLPSPPKESSHD